MIATLGGGGGCRRHGIRRRPQRSSAGPARRGRAGAVAATGSTLGKVLSRGASPSAVALPVAAEALPTLPGGLESTVRGISAFRTPNAQFYRIDTALVIPRAPPTVGP